MILLTTGLMSVLIMAAIMMILALTMTAISRVKIALKIRQQYSRDSIF